ncbi:RloB family protein [Persicitalea jodogahamensis]|nr:RloB family protein [Persicitalea jodogahamensis]
MPKQNRSYKKGAPHRDARLFIIIAEGEREDSYFHWFDARNSRLSILIVDRPKNTSAPKYFIDRINKAEEEGIYSPQANDQVWFVCDVDRWREQIEALRLSCEQVPNWNIAVSNKCFEVWLHFHSGSISHPIDVSCAELKSSLPGTSVGEFNTHKYCPLIKQAAENARAADTNPGAHFPDLMQTKLYKLADAMLEVLGHNW